MATHKDRVTLDRLVRWLEKDSSPPSDHLTHLKLQATVKHAKELLQTAREQPNAVFYPPSTSRDAAPPRDSLADFEQRIARAEQKLADSWELVSATSRASTPVERGGGLIDLDFLLPILPPPMPIPRSSRPQSPSSSVTSTSSMPPADPSFGRARSASPTKRTKRDEPVLVNSTIPPRIENVPSPRPTSPSSSRSAVNSYDLQPHPSELSKSVGSTSGLRHRTAPPWLRNRQLKEAAAAVAAAAAASKEREQGEREVLSRPSDASPNSSRGTTISDLLPASSSTNTNVTSSDLLSHHHALQNSLLSDLTSLSTALKTSTQTFSSNLEKDREVMEEAEKRLQGNEGRLTKEQTRLKTLKTKTRGTTCWTLGVLTLVAAMWIAIFLLIKVT